MAFGNKTYKLELQLTTIHTRNLVSRSFGRCLRNCLLLSGSSMRFTTRPFGYALRRALY
jgi:hypothetical protein